METENAPMHKSEPAQPELRIVLLGTLGAGKSSSGNTILSKGETFNTHASTEKCKLETVNIGGQKVVVVDTPGLFSTKQREDEVVREIKESISLAYPGPHMFLLVVSVDDKFTAKKQETVKIIHRTFGRNTMSYTMVLFTYGDELKRKKTTIEQFIGASPKLQELVIQCQWKYHVFDNEEGSPGQVTDLLQKINRRLDITGRCHYTVEMLKEAESDFQQKVKNTKEEEQQQKAKASQIQTYALFGTGTGCLVGYLIGGGEMTTGAAAAIGGAAGGVLGSITAGVMIFVTDRFKKCTAK